ncbi:hypothetical protein CPC08DRAFT_524947 [Agrocybe pediades]|nr:hypothetical protein CPC08DRAFT_524947 [Agrocybe pediades]
MNILPHFYYIKSRRYRVMATRARFIVSVYFNLSRQFFPAWYYTEHDALPASPPYPSISTTKKSTRRHHPHSSSISEARSSTSTPPTPKPMPVVTSRDAKSETKSETSKSPETWMREMKPFRTRTRKQSYVKAGTHGFCVRLYTGQDAD